MAKEKYYFSHDHNSRNDRKTAALIEDYRAAGYGIFWATCELMHEEDGYLEFDNITIGAIAKDLKEDPTFVHEVLEKCVNQYKLFTKQENLLRSNRVDRNLNHKDKSKNSKAESGRIGGIKSGESRRNAKHHEAPRSNASSNEANEIKGNEIKENKIKGKEEGASPPFEIKLSLPLPANVLEPAEMNQFTHTRQKNTDWIQSQWQIFLSERLNDPPEKIRQYRRFEDVTSYFLNWLRPKTPQKNGKHVAAEAGREIVRDRP